MDLPTLVQFVVKEGTEALVQLKQGNALGSMFFENAQLCHAELIRANERKITGENAVYELLSWRSGRFQVQKGTKSPSYTIEHSWSYLLHGRTQTTR